MPIHRTPGEWLATAKYIDIVKLNDGATIRLVVADWQKDRRNMLKHIAFLEELLTVPRR